MTQILARSVAVFALLTFILTGCGSTPAATPTSAPAAAPTEAPAAAAETPTEEATTEDATAEATATSESSESTEPLKVTVGAVAVPHGEILNFIKENLAAEAGLDIEVVEFTDYVQPNLALNDGQLDANYFQHVPYMEDFGAEHNIDMVSVVAVHIEPLGLYSKKVSSLDELADGATIAIPNDATNGGRALQLLASNGLFTLTEGVGTNATVADIVDNPKNIQIVELEAAQLPRSLEDTDASIINGNYALDAGLTPSSDALVLESGENNPYANILTVLNGHENDEAIQKLASLLTSPEVKKFIEDNYQGSVIPAF
jgi:ABC-type metal ion transport system, periplasmic component/surface antigen